jgi:hypothetical protein
VTPGGGGLCVLGAAGQPLCSAPATGALQAVQALDREDTWYELGV